MINKIKIIDFTHSNHKDSKKITVYDFDVEKLLSLDILVEKIKNAIMEQKEINQNPIPGFCDLYSIHEMQELTKVNDGEKSYFKLLFSCDTLYISDSFTENRVFKHEISIPNILKENCENFDSIDLPKIEGNTVIKKDKHGYFVDAIVFPFESQEQCFSIFSVLERIKTRYEDFFKYKNNLNDKISDVVLFFDEKRKNSLFDLFNKIDINYKTEKIYLPKSIKPKDENFICFLSKQDNKYKPYYIDRKAENNGFIICKKNGEDFLVRADNFVYKTEIPIFCIGNKFKNIAGCKIIEPNLLSSKNIEDIKKLAKQKYPFLVFNSVKSSSNPDLKYLFSHICKKNIINKNESIEMTFNKWLSYLHMKENNIPTPESCLHQWSGFGCYGNGSGYHQKDIMEFPFFVKTLDGSGGHGVKYFKNETEFDDWVSILPPSGLYGTFLMSQKPVLTSLGRCVRVLVANGRIIASYIRQSLDGNEKANVCQGAEVVPYKMNNEWKKLVLRTHKVFDLDVSGIDVLFGENDKPIICEVNGYPGYSGAYKCGVEPEIEILCQFLNKINER